ncbi:MAG: hypothetical protein ACWGO2_10880 [Syntrophobacteria bacterium]
MNNDVKNEHRRQRDCHEKTRPLQAVYLASLALLFCLIVSTPYLIKGNVLLKERIVVGEEIVESALIAVLLIIGYAVSIMYKKELNKCLREIDELTTGKSNLEEKLNEAFGYIGEVNVQVQEIRAVFSALRKYPENKNDFKNILAFFGKRVLGIVNVGWVTFRIIDPDNFRTLHEHWETRGSAVALNHGISNKAIVNNAAIHGCSVVGSRYENLRIKVFCILPIEKLAVHQRILVEAIVNNLEMLFVIFTSEHYRESYLKKRQA